MKNIYFGALELLEDSIRSIGLLMSKSHDQWTIHALQVRMHELHQLKRIVMKRSGLYANVIHVDFQLKRKVS